MHAHARAIVLTYAHALDLSRSELIVRTCAAPRRHQAATMSRRHAPWPSPSPATSPARVALARTRAAELAGAIDLDLSVLSAFDFDLARGA